MNPVALPLLILAGGPITEDDLVYQLIKTHAVVGAELLVAAPGAKAEKELTRVVERSGVEARVLRMPVEGDLESEMTRLLLMTELPCGLRALPAENDTWLLTRYGDCSHLSRVVHPVQPGALTLAGAPSKDPSRRPHVFRGALLGSGAATLLSLGVAIGTNHEAGLLGLAFAPTAGATTGAWIADPQQLGTKLAGAAMGELAMAGMGALMLQRVGTTESSTEIGVLLATGFTGWILVPAVGAWWFPRVTRQVELRPMTWPLGPSGEFVHGAALGLRW